MRYRGMRALKTNGKKECDGGWVEEEEEEEGKIRSQAANRRQQRHPAKNNSDKTPRHHKLYSWHIKNFPVIIFLYHADWHHTKQFLFFLCRFVVRPFVFFPFFSLSFFVFFRFCFHIRVFIWNSDLPFFRSSFRTVVCCLLGHGRFSRRLIVCFFFACCFRAPVKRIII